MLLVTQGLPAMTIVEQISRAARFLTPQERRETLKFIQGFHGKSKPKTPRARKRKTLGEARKALAAVRGMWKDRTDLPTDTVEASVLLRRRVMSRDKHA
jgi:hypothetical protein